jgi:hypothetical protein
LDAVVVCGAAYASLKEHGDERFVELDVGEEDGGCQRESW